MVLYLYGLPPQNPLPQHNHEIIIRQIPLERHCTKHLTSSQKWEDHQNKENLRMCHGQEDPK